MTAVPASSIPEETRDFSPVLRTENLSLVYRTRQGDLPALRDLDLSVRQGEFVSVLGPSGCGKSTLLRIAAGLIRPTSGSLTVAGRTMDGPHKEIGVAFQKSLLLPWKTVRDNVLMPVHALGRVDAEATHRADALLDLMGLGAFAKHYPRELSGGMQQRVGLARMLVRDPSLLLMDEPFAALDAMTREKLTFELQRIWMTTQKSVLFITHSIPEAVMLSDRVLVMSARPGRIVDSVPVDLPRPRSVDTLSSRAFIETCDHLRRHFS